MIHPLKITNTLADETRFNIYEFMLQQKKTYTVQDIANQFHIHPNVARLHLTKLSEINLIHAEFLNSGKGGRPGRVYKASEDGIDLSFPTNQNHLLINWAVKIIEEVGPSAIDSAKKISYNEGFEQMTQLIEQLPKSATTDFDRKLELLTSASTLIGYIPQTEETEIGTKIYFTIYNCPFKNQINTNNEIICSLHESYLRGQINALFPEYEFIQTENMIQQCDFCKYEIFTSSNTTN